jgi:hypothetical protein
METCEVTFNETQPCNSSVFECVGEDEVGKKIFEDEEDDARATLERERSTREEVQGHLEWERAALETA